MKTDRIISILNELGMDEGLTIQERTAVNEACMAMMSMQRKIEPQVDFQGWEIKKLTMKDLRKFVRDNGALDDDVNLLVLEDDGMGYGANNGYCSELSVSETEDEDGKKKEVHIWF